MKIRIKENSVRIRITQSELTNLSNGDAVTERTYFPGGSVFVHTLIKSPSTSRIAISFDGYEMIVSIPEAAVRDWSESDEPGIEEILPNGRAGGLQILIEKDYACLHKRSEDVDVFPNPKALANP